MHQAPDQVTPRRQYWAVAVVLLAYILLGIVYSVASPLFEPSDEHNHYPFVQHLATGGSLPIQRPGEQTLWGQEGSQPPLYYALSAALTSWIPTADMQDLLYRNPHDRRGVPGVTEDANMYIHTDQEAFPWHDTALAVHLIRLFSVLLGAGAVLCTYVIARSLFPDRPGVAIGAAAMNAFIPMFVFIGASVNNDNLVVFLSSLALLLIVRIAQRGASPGRLVALGVIIGLAALTKLERVGSTAARVAGAGVVSRSRREVLVSPRSTALGRRMCAGCHSCTPGGRMVVRAQLAVIWGSDRP